MAIPGNAQDDDDHHDFNTWWQVELDVEVHKKFEISLKEAIRTKENSSQINTIFTDIGFKYSPAKFVDISTGLRFLQAKKKNDYQFNLRHNTDVSFKHKAGNFKFKHRIRYVHKDEMGVSKAEGDVMTHQFRILTGFSYNIPKCALSPYFNIELYNRFESDEDAHAEKVRFKLGATYSFKTAGELDLFFGYERFFKKEELENISIIALSYKFSITTWKKKDDDSKS